MGKHDGELIATEPRARVTRAHLSVNAVGDFLQNGIPGEVPVEIVDPLEVIHIDHEASDRLVYALSARQLLA